MIVGGDAPLPARNLDFKALRPRTALSGRAGGGDASSSPDRPPTLSDIILT
jgi:hypothetical protein